MKIKHPIFIVDCGHSGNSLMLRILGNCPSIHPISEETNIFYKSSEEIKKAINDFDIFCLEANKKRFTEKTPKHIYKINKIFDYYPESQVILMLRDGRDVACSLKARNKDFTLGVDRWVKDNLEGCKHWNDPRVKVVKYEDLVNKPQETLEVLMNFLGEDYTDNILDCHTKPKKWFGASDIVKPKSTKNIQDHKNLRNWQVNQPIFDGSGRWKQEMSSEEKKHF